MNTRIEIIAEVAQGYEGSPHLLSLLTKGALHSGADAVKYQLVFADELATPDYQYYELFRSLEMSDQVWLEASSILHDNQKNVYFDIFGTKSLALAKKVGADGVKLSTTEFYNEELIIEALATFKKVFISVGGIPEKDIDTLISNHLSKYNGDICFMYGFQSEPTPLKENNLLKLTALRKKYSQFFLGFMDHSDGGSEEAFQLSLIAMGMGINCIEKHITLDRKLEIEDYVSALSVDSFCNFSKLIKKMEPALGTESLELSDSEQEYQNKATKCVTSLRNLKKGATIQRNDISLRRSGIQTDRVLFRQISDVLGQTLQVDIMKDNPIFEGDL